MILRITDGTTTISLIGGTDGIYGGEEYVPRPPDVSEIEFEAEALYDGGELIEATRRNVAESLPLALVGSTPSAIQTVQHSLETLLEQALHRQRRGVGDRVYLEYRPGDSGDIYRSEILRGVVEPSQATASDKWLDVGAVGVVIAWKRRFYWEGPEVELPLTNAHGTGTGGVTVYNCHDSEPRDNFVDIDGSDVEGVIPAACRILLQNTYDSTSRAQTLTIGQNIWSYPASLDHILEGEEAAYAAGGNADPVPTTPDFSSYSNGQYKPASWTGDDLTQVMRWALDATRLSHCAGGWFRLWAKLPYHTTGVRITPKITFPSGTPLTVVSEAPEVELTSSVDFQDLGVLQLPPWLRGETDLYPVDLTLYGRRSGGATFNVDFVQLTPLDGYRVLRPRGYGAAYTVTIVDDGMSGNVYTYGWSGSQKTGHYLTRGKPIMLWPGKDQRLYFLDTVATQLLRTFSVQVYYRPRRLTL